MNAPDRLALGSSAVIDRVSPEKKALVNLWAMLRKFPHKLEPHDLRYCEVVLEGLGVKAPQRRKEIEALIQAKRDYLVAKRAARAGGRNEAA